MSRFGREVTAWVSVIVLSASFLSDCAAQTGEPSAAPLSTELNKYPGLLPEFGRLLERLKHEVQLPPPRYESYLLPLLPASTTYFAAIPNFGEAANQALGVFKDELSQSSVLNAWWRGEVGQTGPQLEDAIEKFYQISRYLGDEIVVAGESGHAKPRLLLTAQIRKPGLEEYLRQLLQSSPDKSKPNFRIVTQRDLKETATQWETADFLVLVRSEFAIAGPDRETIASLNTLLDTKNNEFVSTPFGERLALAYQAGTETLCAADLQSILIRDRPGNPANRALLDASGFGDMKYFVWNHKKTDDEGVSESELSFTGPRRDAASWLVSPGPLPSLDFVSPKALMVLGLLLKNFGEIFDNLKEISVNTNPNARASVSQMEQVMHINLKDELLSQFPGEVTFELNSVSPEQQPIWNVILRVTDPVQVQKAMDKLAVAWSARTAQFEQEGTLYHSIMFPASQKEGAVYAFVDGYLVLGSSREAAITTIRIHKSGESFAKATLFQTPLPAGYSSDVSALFYENAAALASSAMRQLPAEAAAQLSTLTTATAPVVLRAYGENSAIRGLSVEASADPTMMLILAAIAIPNLLRARIAANESAAVSTMRMVNTAQALYSATYPQRRYAPDLASLGPDLRGPGFKSPEHAGLLDNILGNSSCTAGKWCARNGFQFTLVATCKLNLCSEFVVLATPINSGAGTRSFCSASDAVIRYRSGGPLESPVTPAECRTWLPLR
ncbi:MAG TPA: hypothetical protein VF753_07100 [Terriglobales bacterium]